MSRYFTSIVIISSILMMIILSLPNDTNNSGGSQEGEVFPKERLQWEWMRYRDPATNRIPKGINTQVNQYIQSNIPGSVRMLRKNKLDKLQSHDWVRRGPYYTGGRVRALALDVLDENIIHAGGVSGGMWKSIDGGQNWIRTTDVDVVQSVSCIAQDTREGKENIWYYGTGELWGNSADISGDGIFKSTDGGNSWFVLPSTTKNTPNSWDNQFEYIWNIVTNPVAPEGNDELYVAPALGGIIRTTDGGETWVNVLGDFGNRYSLFTDIAVTSDGVFYAALSQKASGENSSLLHGIFRSDDGETWTNITPDGWPPVYNRVVIGIAPSDENQVYFLANSPGYGQLTTNSRGDEIWNSLWKYTYVKDDGDGDGGIWEDRSLSIPKPELVRHQYNPQYSYNMVIKVHPEDSDVVYLGGVNLDRSTDGFKTSENTTLIGGTCPDETCPYHYRYINHHSDLHAITFLPSDPDVLFTGSDGGVHKTLDNLAGHVEWISLNNGFFTTQFYTIAIDHGSDSEEILGGLQDNGTLFDYSTELTNVWPSPVRADGFHCAIADGGSMYYASQNTNSPVKVKMWKFKMDDMGEVTDTARIDPAEGEEFIWNTPIILDPTNNSRMYVAGGFFVWRNNNLDEIPLDGSKDSTMINWDRLDNTQIDPETNDVVEREGKITAIAASENPANVVYYGTASGEVFRLDNAHEGDPIPVNVTGANFPMGYVGSIAIDPDDADEAFVVFTNYNILSVFRTIDGGQTWEPVSGNLEASDGGSGPGPATLYLEIMKVQGQKYYLLGTSAGLFSTVFLNGMGTVWTQEGAETIGNIVVDMVDARSSDGFVAIGTHGGGVFSTRITDLPALPDKVNLLSPENGTLGISKKIQLEWEADNSTAMYILQIAKDEEFNNIVKEYNAIRGTSMEVENFEQGLVNYYWRVAAVNSAGIGPYSDARSFQTTIAAPENIYPLDGQEDVPVKVRLEWTQPEGAETYSLTVSKTILFNQVVIEETEYPDTYYILEDLETSRKYYWRTRSKNENGESLESEIWWFKTRPVSSVEESIHQAEFDVYPNPAKDVLSLKFELDKPYLVNMNIYDINGRPVRSGLKMHFPEGMNQATISVESLNQGQYFYIFSAGNLIKRGNFTIIK